MSWRWRIHRKIAKVQEEIQKLEQKSSNGTAYACEADRRMNFPE